MSGSHNAHSVLSPSAASRWTTCTASVPFIHLNSWEGRDSAESREGTRAHDLAEMILKGEMHSPPEGFEQLSEYVDLCRSLHNRWGGHILVEEKVKLFYRKENKGTMDFGLVSTNRICTVDLKWGKGVAVGAHRNKQLAIYTMSFLEEIQSFYGFADDTPVDIFVCQPRCADEDAGGCWSTTVGELRAFCETEILPHVLKIDRAFEAISGGADFLSEVEFRPSVDSCRFCPAKQNGKCSHRITQAFAPLLPEAPDPIDVLEVLPDTEITPVIPDMRLVSDNQLLSIFLRIPELKAVISGVIETIKMRAVLGDPVPGTKVVEGRKKNTAWVDESHAFTQLSTLFPEGTALRKETLKSPKAISEMAKKDKNLLAKIKELTHRAPGKPSLALESDKRPAISTAIQMLEVLDEEEEN